MSEGKVTKTEAVRQALAANIEDIWEIRAFAKRLGVDFPEEGNAISVLKSSLKKKAGTPSTAKRGRPAGSKTTTTATVSASPVTNSSVLGVSETVVAVQNLARQVGGPEKLAELPRLVGTGVTTWQ